MHPFTPTLHCSITVFTANRTLKNMEAALLTLQRHIGSHYLCGWLEGFLLKKTCTVKQECVYSESCQWASCDRIAEMDTVEHPMLKRWCDIPHWCSVFICPVSTRKSCAAESARCFTPLTLNSCNLLITHLYIPETNKILWAKVCSDNGWATLFSIMRYYTPPRPSGKSDRECLPSSDRLPTRVWQ